MTQFFALVASQQGMQTTRIQLGNQLKDELAALFQQQADELLSEELEDVDFCGTYKLDESEVFVINDFSLPESILEAAERPQLLEALALSRDSLPDIKSIFGVHRVNAEDIRYYFQSFDRRRLIKPEWFTILLSRGTFEKMENPAITIDNKVAAVLAGGSLRFRSYRAVNSYLDLGEYFTESTDGGVREVVQHAYFHTSSEVDVVGMADSWMRRRFAAIKESGVLESPLEEILDRATGMGVPIPTVMVHGHKKITFPDNKREAKTVLRFLAEEIFSGAISGETFQTNSKRPFGA